LTRNDIGATDSSDPLVHDDRLKSRSNPRSNLDYVVLLEGAGSPAGNRVKLRYIPDKLLIESASFDAYLAALANAEAGRPEMLALAILDDINNEIVPRWVQISVSADSADTTAQTVIVEDRQPNWDNANILGNLAPF